MPDTFAANAAARAYNAGAEYAGYFKLTPEIDETIRSGTPDDAERAFSNLVDAGEALMKWGSELINQAQSLAKKRDWSGLEEAEYTIKEQLPKLVKLAERIEDPG